MPVGITSVLLAHKAIVLLLGAEPSMWPAQVELREKACALEYHREKDEKH